MVRLAHVNFLCCKLLLFDVFTELINDDDDNDHDDEVRIQ